MPIEIERKFLVSGDGWRAAAHKVVPMAQGYLNDLAMLEFAGQPFAMGNAHPLLRERFEVVGTNAEGGVGATLRRLLAG